MRWFINGDITKKGMMNYDDNELAQLRKELGKELEYGYYPPRGGWRLSSCIPFKLKPPTRKEKRILEARSRCRHFHFDVV